jgi:hypothetical protein
MKALEEAIKTKFEGTAGLSTLGTLYFDRAPENTSFPLGVLVPSTSRVVEGFGSGYVQEYAYTFHLFSPDKDALQTLQEALHSAFDRCSMTVTGNRFMSCQRTMSLTRVDIGSLHRTGELVYQSMSNYGIRVDRTFA